MTRTTKTRIRRKMIECAHCQRLKVHHGRGLCPTCYKRARGIKDPPGRHRYMPHRHFRVPPERDRVVERQGLLLQAEPELTREQEDAERQRRLPLLAELVRQQLPLDRLAVC